MEFEIQCGATLGRYQLLTRLGQGGMASVWVARERSFGGAERLVAVKAMLPDLAAREDFRSMFLEEGQIVRSISHNNVVSVFDVAEDYGILYMAMEWVEGDSLRTIIRDAKKRRAIPPEMAVRMIADTAAGLHAAHELRDWDGRLCGLVHCDVSPHNILVGLNGQAKLVDFGVASATARTDKGQEMLKGKLGYMSPEQVLGTGLDRRSDVFSLGVVLYELTTGERLFRGESPRDTLKLVSDAKVPKPTDVYDKYPPALEEIVLKALARNVEERYQTADDLRIALDRYLISERILVSQAGVGRLVTRVLGARIEQQREAIKDALRAIDGHIENSLLPTDPTAVRDGSGELSLSGKSSPFADASWTSTPAPSSTLSAGPNSLSDPTGTASPQTIERTVSVPRKKSRLAFVGVGLVTLAGLAVGALWLQSLGGTGPEFQAAPGQQPIGPDESESESEAGEETQDPSASELLQPGLGRDAEAISPGQAEIRRPQGGPRVGARKSSKAERERAEVAGREAVAAVRAGNEPATLPPPTASPIELRPDFNSGAATASLSAGSARAAGCGKPGGPTGAGQATVTFHSDGYVSNVKVPEAFAGTKVGSCIVSAFRQSSIPAFRGLPKTLSRSFRVPE